MDWQSIDTKPTSGEALFTNGTDVACLSADDVVCEYNGAGEPDGPPTYKWMGRLTHWMPLPRPPEPENDGVRTLPDPLPEMRAEVFFRD